MLDSHYHAARSRRGRERGAMTMRVPRLHVDGPLAADGSLPLPEAAGRHVTKVLRLGPGDALVVFDGLGGEYDATVARVSCGVVAIEVGAYRPVDRESALAVELGQGVCRSDRMDLVVQKATELGGGRTCTRLLSTVPGGRRSA